MTLLRVDGFDSYANLAQMQTRRSYSGAASFSTSGTRFGVGQYINPSNGLLLAMSQITSFVHGFAFRATSISTIATLVNYEDSTAGGVTIQIQLRFTAAGALIVMRGGGFGGGGTILAQSVDGVIPLNTWLYMEVKATIDPTVGAVAVRLNGLPVSGISDLTNVNTRNSANSFTDGVRFGYNANGQYTMDDEYFCSQAGAKNNDFLGDCRVETLRPSGAGTTTQFTPSTGSNFQNVDETTPNDDTDYNFATAAGLKDTYALADLSTASGLVYGVQSIIRVRKADSNARSVQSVIRSGASESQGAVLALATGYQEQPDVFEDKPGGSGWTIADVNGMEAGLQVVA